MFVVWQHGVAPHGGAVGVWNAATVVIIVL
jgi:hypothetical protein